MNNRPTALFRQKWNVLLIIVWILLFSCRILYLDSDLPAWGKINYQPIDEGAYSHLAINIINTGTINPDIENESLNFFTAPHVRTNFIGNLFTYIGIKLLGDNYYGLRIGSIITMFINSLLMLLVLTKLHERYSVDKKKSRRIIISIMFYSAFDFSSIVASRVNETSIYRMLFVLLSIFVFVYMEKQVGWRFFLIGFLSVFSTFGIYITNIYLVVATGLVALFVIFERDKKKTVKSWIAYFAGGSLAFILCEVYFIVFWKTTIIKNTLEVFSSFSSVSGYGNAYSIRSFIKTSISFCANNFNLYNIGVFFLFLIAIPKIVFYIKKHKDVNIFFIFSIYILLFLQTFISEDYVRRKYIMVVPIMYIIIYLFFIIPKEKIIISQKKYYNLYNLSYVLLCSIISLSVIAFRLLIVRDRTRNDFSILDKQILCMVSVIIIIILCHACIYHIFKRNKKYVNAFLISAIIISIFTNIYMDYNYIFKNPTFTEKELMVGLKDLQLESNCIVGVFMIGYTLYNDYTPIINNYKEMRKILVKDPNFFYLDYAIEDNPGMIRQINSIMKGTKYKLVPVKEFNRDFQTFGLKRNITLYKVVKK